jgi:acyl-coenzyme A thioesterase PaaI-like protein
VTDTEARKSPHILSELGFSVRRDGEEMIGEAPVTPHLCVPGTEHLRTSVLAVWIDFLAGFLAVITMNPRVPVTIELDVHLFRPAPGNGLVRGVAKTLKQGRTTFVADVEFSTGDGEPLAIGAASFMVAPDPSLRIESFDVERREVVPSISIPLAERARCERMEPGRARLLRSEDGLNSANTINGGLVALVSEEAALSLAPGSTLSSMSLRYLQPIRTGPAIATARATAGLGQVEVRDAGNDNRLSVTVTTRYFSGPE